MLNKVY